MENCFLFIQIIIFLPFQVIKGSPSQFVKLNVGGALHYTTIGTLTKQDSLLRDMFSGCKEVLTDSEGKFFFFFFFFFFNI